MSEDKKSEGDSKQEEERKERDLLLLKMLLTELFEIQMRGKQFLRDPNFHITFPDEEKKGDYDEFKTATLHLDPKAYDTENPFNWFRNLSLTSDIPGTSTDNVDLLANHFVHSYMQERIRDKIARHIGDLFDRYVREYDRIPQYFSYETQFAAAAGADLWERLKPYMASLHNEIAREAQNLLPAEQLTNANRLQYASVACCISLILLLVSFIAFIVIAIAKNEPNIYAIIACLVSLCLTCIATCVYRRADQNLRHATAGRTVSTLPELVWRIDTPEAGRPYRSMGILKGDDAGWYFSIKDLQNILNMDPLGEVFAQHASPEAMSILIALTYTPAIASGLTSYLPLGEESNDRKEDASYVLPQTSDAPRARIEANVVNTQTGQVDIVIDIKEEEANDEKEEEKADTLPPTAGHPGNQDSSSGGAAARQPRTRTREEMNEARERSGMYQMRRAAPPPDDDGDKSAPLLGSSKKKGKKREKGK